MYLVVAWPYLMFICHVKVVSFYRLCNVVKFDSLQNIGIGIFQTYVSR